MKSRKLITVITNTVNSTNSELIRGIITQSQLLGCDTAVFSLFSENAEETDHQIGEEMIFEQIDFKNTDGIIFLDESFWIERILYKTADLIKSRFSGPVICLNSSLPSSYGFENFKISDKQNFINIVSHLIEDHGYTKIMCLTGPKGNYSAEERLAGYIEAMKKHGLCIPDKYIVYGDFWKDSACRLSDRIAAGRSVHPQAVACANDIMAVTLVNELEKRGIRVPDDIAVTGFDAINDSVLNTPSVTTYSPDERSYGAACVCRLLNMTENRHIHSLRTSPGHIVYNDSCGCRTTDTVFLKKIKDSIRKKQQNTDILERSSMPEELMSVSGIDELINCVDRFTYVINEYERYFLCLRYSILCDLSSGILPEKKDQNIILLDKIEFTRVTKNRVLNSDETITDIFSSSDHPAAFFFSPLHFDDKFYGFSAVSYKKSHGIPDNVYRSWNRYISSAIHMLYIRNSNTVLKQNTAGSAHSVPVPPRWMNIILNEMNRPENFIAGLPRLLEMAHVSQEHLTRSFRKYLGITPTEYINRLRLEFAAKLLRKDHHNITEVCFLSGFGNISHFYHQFSRYFGCSPKAYSQEYVNSKKTDKAD